MNHYSIDAQDYTDRFKELLREAVGDRLRTNKIGIFMSGELIRRPWQLSPWN